MKKFFHLVVLGFLALLFTACVVTPNRAIYNGDSSDTYAFNVGGNSALQNPPADRARVYIISSPNFKESNQWIFRLYFQYNPTIQEGKLIEQRAKYINNEVTKIVSGTKLSYDFEPNKPLLLIVGNETMSYLLFTPKAGKIYCTEGEPVMGWAMARFNLKFVDKSRCETLYLQ